MPNSSKEICSGSVSAASWPCSIAWRVARVSVSIQARWPVASASRTTPGLSSNSMAPPIIGQPPGRSADSVQPSHSTNSAFSRGRPRGLASAGLTTTLMNSCWPRSITASSSSSREPKWAKRPDFDRPVAAARVPIVRPSRPALLTMWNPASSIAARVRSPFVAVLRLLMRRNNSTNVRIRQQPPKVLTRMAVSACRELLGRPLGDDLPAAVAAFRTEVDHPVRGLDHIQVVFDDHNRVACVAQPVQHVQQHPDVVEVQAGGRLIQYVQRTAGVALGEFERELDALRRAAGQRDRALAELDIAQADVGQRFEFLADR